MTAKTAFSDEEWRALGEAPMTAGMILVTASGGGTLRETFALARAYDDQRKQHGASELLDDLVAEKPKFDRHRYGSTDELRRDGLQAVAAAAELLRAKATPDEQSAYAQFVLGVAEKVASAHKEHGQAVSPPEQAALDDIRGQLEGTG
jgi:hypothetical protein